MTACSAPDCDHPRKTRGLCDMHYKRALRSIEDLPPKSQNDRETLGPKLRSLLPATTASIAIHLHLSPSSIRRWCKRLGLRQLSHGGKWRLP